MFSRRIGLRAVTRAVAVVALATTTTVAATGGAASAEEEDVPPVITLTASEYATGSGNSVWLYANANEAELNTSLQIVEAESGWVIANCGSTTDCQTWVSAYSGARTYYARVVVNSTSLPFNERSASNPVTVYWHGVSVVTLTATPPVATVDTSIRLDATADDVFYDGYLSIWEITNPSSPVRVHSCPGATCSVDVVRTTAGTRKFVAHYNAGWDVNYYYGYDATSDEVTAQWVDEPGGAPSASSLCDDGQQIVDSTTQGFLVKMYTEQPSANQTDVCVRVQDASGRGFGGRFVVTPTVPDADVTNVQEPSQDDQSGACTTTTPNAVPGAHPVSAGGVAGQPYLVDAYSTTGQAWICLKAGSTNVRLKVPVAVPGVTVTPGTQVTFTPDAGTPDVL